MLPHFSQGALRQQQAFTLPMSLSQRHGRPPPLRILFWFPMTSNGKVVLTADTALCSVADAKDGDMMSRRRLGRGKSKC